MTHTNEDVFEAELSNVEIVALAFDLVQKPLLIPEIHMVIRKRLGIRLSKKKIQSAVYNNPDYFMPIDSDYVIDGFRTEYIITEEGEELVDAVWEDLEDDPEFEDD